ncbi:unnamed protein product, partial [Rhizoctonia solani]
SSYSNGESPITPSYHHEFTSQYARPFAQVTPVSSYPYIPHNATAQEHEACSDRIRAIRARSNIYTRSIYSETSKPEVYRARPETNISGIDTLAGRLTVSESFTDTRISGEESDSSGPYTPHGSEHSLWKDLINGVAEPELDGHSYLPETKAYSGSQNYYPPAPPIIPEQERMTELPFNDFTTPASSTAHKELGQVVYEFHTLILGFKFPSNLEFTTPGAGELPRMMLTPTSKPLLEHNHKLEKLLERLDAIESHGNEEIQRMRKQAVERMLSELDRLKRMESMALYNFNYERGISA